MIIAIDGPAASGKGTLGKRLAVALWPRDLIPACFIGRWLRRWSRPVIGSTMLPGRWRLHALDPAQFDERALKSHAAGEAASVVSAIPEVRARR